jgi:hypothetical protein
VLEQKHVACQLDLNESAHVQVRSVSGSGRLEDAGAAWADSAVLAARCWQGCDTVRSCVVLLGRCATGVRD